MFGSDLSGKVCKKLVGWFLFGALVTAIRNHYFEQIFLKFNIGWPINFHWPRSVFTHVIQLDYPLKFPILDFTEFLCSLYVLWWCLVFRPSRLRSSHKFITVLLQLGSFANEARFYSHIFQHSLKCDVSMRHIFLCGT